MARPRKDGVKVSLILDKDISDNLDAFCEGTGRTKTKVIELALINYMNIHKSEMNELVDCNGLNFVVGE